MLVVNVPYLEIADDDLNYLGWPTARIELSGEEQLTLRRVYQGMVDAAVPTSSRSPAADAVRYLTDLATAAANA